MINEQWEKIRINGHGDPVTKNRQRATGNRKLETGKGLLHEREFLAG